MLTAAAGGAKLEAHTPLGAMSEEQLKAFLEAVKADAGLQEQLKAAADADAVVAIAKAAGFVISAEEASNTAPFHQISEDELEQAAGGGGNTGTCDCYGGATNFPPYTAKPIC